MASPTYRPGSAKATALAVEATYDPRIGWSLTFVRYAESEPLGRRTMMAYTGLSDSELVDVIDVELASALQVE